MSEPLEDVKYVDVPQNFEPRVGGDFYEGLLRELLRELAQLAGRSQEDVDLAGGPADFEAVDLRVLTQAEVGDEVAGRLAFLGQDLAGLLQLAGVEDQAGADALALAARARAAR